MFTWTWVSYSRLAECIYCSISRCRLEYIFGFIRARLAIKLIFRIFKQINLHHYNVPMSDCVIVCHENHVPSQSQAPKS